MKFAPCALSQFVVSATTYSVVFASDDHGSVDDFHARLRSGQRERGLESTFSDTVEWHPQMTLDISYPNRATSCHGGSCNISRCSDSVRALKLARPAGYGDHVVTQVSSSDWASQTPVTLFNMAPDTTNDNCLTVPDPSGKWRGIKLSSTDGIEATVFENGEVVCYGGRTPSCRIDFSWLPSMTLQVTSDTKRCEAAAGCAVEGTMSCDSCSIPDPPFELARHGFGTHVVREFYSPTWGSSLTTFYSELGSEANIGDCLTDPIGDLTPQRYEGIQLGGRISANIYAHGSVICRSLTKGASCVTDAQCLTDSCIESFCTGFLFGEACEGDDECESSLCTDGVCRKPHGELCTSDAECASVFCNTDTLEDYGFARCDDIGNGQEGTFCSVSEQCNQGLECAHGFLFGGKSCQVCIEGYCYQTTGENGGVHLTPQDGHDEYVVDQVSSPYWAIQIPVTLFTMATHTTNDNCLAIPDGSGNWRGIKLSATDGIQAIVFENGEVACYGGTTPSCRTDYSWLPTMTLNVKNDARSCEDENGCTIQGRLYGTRCTRGRERFEISGLDGLGEHVVQEIYSSRWANPLSSFHARSGVESNIEDCLTDPIAGTEPQQYGGIKIRGEADAPRALLVDENGEVICRSLSMGASCTSQYQCLSDNCVNGSCGKFLYGATCTSDDECESNFCIDESCAKVPHGGSCTKDADCMSDHCSIDALEDYGFKRCTDIDEGEEGAFCSNTDQCDPGFECVEDASYGGKSCQLPM